MEAVKIIINGAEVSASKGATVLEAARSAKVAIPTLYYLKGIVNTDESGVCVAEVNGSLVNASTTCVEEGMTIVTNSPAVMGARAEALTKILAVHDFDCSNCGMTGTCELRALAHEYNVGGAPSLSKEALKMVDDSSVSLVRDTNKCIRCGRCVAVCGKVQGIGALTTVGEGLAAEIVPMNDPFAKGVGLGAVNCVNCGQCIAVCPVGALSEKDNTAEVAAALADPDKYVVVQVAPSVRAALGEAFEFPLGVDVEGKIAAALRLLGFDKVFDTTFSADLTIVEEANEFANRLQSGGTLPLITSCCPGWVNYCEHYHANLLPNVSSCKSPQQMFGAVAKSYYVEKMGIDKEKLVVVSVMPCVAKKGESKRPEMDGDVDISITTNELARMIKKAGIMMEALANEEFDAPLGLGTGAGVIFGATGGVMEAALRTAVEKLTGKALTELNFSEVRGVQGVKEATYDVNGTAVKVAVVSGLANADKLLKQVECGLADYHFIEIMACPGGCVNGGGQPHQSAAVHEKVNVAAERAAALYRNDEKRAVRKSHDNPAVVELYKTYLGEVGGEKAHHLLHTTYSAK